MFFSECSPGTYKTNFGLAENSCTDCPENSNHTKYGSTTVDDCKCNKGFEGKKSGTGCFSKSIFRLTTNIIIETPSYELLTYACILNSKILEKLVEMKNVLN